MFNNKNMFNKEEIENLNNKLSEHLTLIINLQQEVNRSFFPFGLKHKIEELDVKIDLLLNHLNLDVEDCPSKKLVNK